MNPNVNPIPSIAQQLTNHFRRQTLSARAFRPNLLGTLQREIKYYLYAHGYKNPKSSRYFLSATHPEKGEIRISYLDDGTVIHDGQGTITLDFISRVSKWAKTPDYQKAIDTLAQLGTGW